MHTKAQLQEVKSLHQPKFRQMYDNFIAEGDKVCTELIKRRQYEIKMIFSTTENVRFRIPTDLHDKLFIISSKEMSQISALKTPSELFLVLAMPKANIEGGKIEFKKAIFLDGVQDPGNVGTIIRIADWFGIDTVIRSQQCADFYNPKTVQATMGSLANVKLFTAELSAIVSSEITVVGTDMNGQDINGYNLPTKAILVMGSEGSGISAENRGLVTEWVKISGSQSRLADSLNVGIATGIICSRWV
jgi:TrmH family RNA methyltransferase